MPEGLSQSLKISIEIEALLVSKNPRGMALLRPELEPGYILRAAKILNGCKGTVLIGTGFPVAGTFETDGPVGAISLYQALRKNRGESSYCMLFTVIRGSCQ